MRPHQIIALVVGVLAAGLQAVPTDAGPRPFEIPRLGPAAGAYGVGYRIESAFDASRSFGPRHDETGSARPGLLARPVRVHIWYPTGLADESAPMPYAGYIRAASGVEAAAAPTDPSGTEAEAAYLALPLRRKADPARLAALLESPTRAVRDAAPAAGRFPLILYAPSINADPFENAVLFERLASRGYVVASMPCMGPDEPETGRDEAGAAAQLDDLRFLLSRMAERPGIDTDRVGALGYSWGGTSALLLALQHAGIDAVATLDAAVGFAEYRPVARSFRAWSPQALRAAFLEIVPGEEPREPALAEEARYADWYLWRVPALRHRDFSSDFLLKLRWAAADPAFERIWGLYGAIADGLDLFFDAALKGDRRALDELRAIGDAGASGPCSYRPALPPPPTAAEFDRIIREDGVDAAVTRFRAVRASNPQAVLFDRTRLLRYPVEWGPERADDLLKLLEIQVEAYPDSAEAHFWMAQVYAAKDERGRAVRELETALKLDPGFERAARLLEVLRRG
jgi:tetratricopeptide (TPR) repeat protein